MNWVCLAVAMAFGEPPPATLAGLQASHIEANVPAEAEFDRLLGDALVGYFKAHGLKQPVVGFELLRKGPTQTGVSYPKYYAWVKVRDGSRISEGAVRAAAIERSRFEITDYMQSDKVTADAAASVFPAALVPLIMDRAQTVKP